MDDLLATIQQAAGVAPPQQSAGAPPAFDPAKSYGTPAQMLDNLQNQESSGGKNLVNPKTGAMGPYQFTPSTIAMLRNQGIKFDPFDPKESRAAADWYLQKLKTENGGTYQGALKAYGGFSHADPTQYVDHVMNGVPGFSGGPQPTTPGQSYSGQQQSGYTGPTSDLMSTLQSAIAEPAKQATPAQAAAPSSGAQPETLLQKFGHGMASVADTALGIGTFIPQTIDYAVRRGAWQTPEQAEQATSQEVTTTPIGDLFGVKNTPGYQGEISHQLMQFISSHLDKGFDWIAQQTGLPKQDLANMASTLSMAAPEVASRAGGALSGLKDVAGEAVQRTVASDMERPAPAQSAYQQARATYQAQAERTSMPGMTSGRGSVGAAGASYAEQARAEGVAEPIVQRIAQQEQQGTLNPTAAQRHIESQSLPVPVELTAGQATGDVNLLSQEQNMRGKNPNLAERFNAQNGQIAANFDAIRDRVAPDVNVPAGHALDQEIVDAYKRMDEPIKADIAAKYKALEDANGGQFPLSGRDFANAADNALKTQSKAYSRFLPGTVSSLLDDFRGGGPMTFNDFESLRTILANEARKADRAGDGNAVHAIGIVRDSLESLPMTDETAALKPLADAARAAARQRFETLAADPAYKAAVTDGVGMNEPSPAADGFFRKYVVQGKSANVQNMMRNLSSDSQSAQLLSAGMIDHIKSQSGIDLRTGSGNVSQAGLNKALTNLREKPAIVLGTPTAQTLEKLGNVARYTQEQPRGSFVNNSNTFVAGAAEAAKSAAEGVANRLTFGIPVGTWTRQGLAKKALNKQVRTSLEPGAGVQSSGVPLNRLIQNNARP